MRPACVLFACGSIAVASIVGCGAASGPKEASAEPESIVTGRSCARAIGNCGQGLCSIQIDNRCDTPVTCQLRVETLCQTSGGDVGPAHASTKHVTQLQGTKRLLEAQTDCGQGTPVATKVEALDCI